MKMEVKSLGFIQLLATPWTSLPGSSIHRIFQARVLEWGAIAFSPDGLGQTYLGDRGQYPTAGHRHCLQV